MNALRDKGRRGERCIEGRVKKGREMHGGASEEDNRDALRGEGRRG